MTEVSTRMHCWQKHQGNEPTVVPPLSAYGSNFPRTIKMLDSSSRTRTITLETWFMMECLIADSGSIDSKRLWLLRIWKVSARLSQQSLQELRRFQNCNRINLNYEHMKVRGSQKSEVVGTWSYVLYPFLKSTDFYYFLRKIPKKIEWFLSFLDIWLRSNFMYEFKGVSSCECNGKSGKIVQYCLKLLQVRFVTVTLKIAQNPYIEFLALNHNI